MKKMLIEVLAGLGIALVGCVLTPGPITRARVPGPPPRPPIWTEDVIKLVRAGIGEPEILERIRSDGISAAPSSDDLVALKKEGASDWVIETMLTARFGSPVVAVPPIVVYPYSSSWSLYYDGPWGWGYPYGFYPWGWHFGFRHHW